MQMDRGPTSEQLMAEMAWVRRLARARVRDDAVADDVAQETWVVAAERRPAADRSLRPWLARVVSNLVRTQRRAELRREARETSVEDSRRVHTPAELIERVELQRVVAEEVLALGEPYRSTVLLHFFEGISSVELAERLGVPAGTVRRRLKVALDQLREALRKRANPPDRGWLAALAPLANAPASRAPEVSTVMGVLAVKKLIAIAVLIIVAASAGFIWHRRRAARPRPQSSLASSTLFTRSALEPRLSAEPAHEIECADRVDATCACSSASAHDRAKSVGPVLGIAATFNGCQDLSARQPFRQRATRSRFHRRLVHRGSLASFFG
jgi:RNA polymerase sigma-70 factor (ECF subfamily)